MSFQKAFEMKYSADELRGFIDSSPTLTWSCSSDGSAEFCNRRWLDYTGLSAEEALGWSWKVAIHPDDLPHMLEVFHEGLNSGSQGKSRPGFAASTARVAGSCFAQCRCGATRERSCDGVQSQSFVFNAFANGLSVALAILGLAKPQPKEKRRNTNVRL